MAQTEKIIEPLKAPPLGTVLGEGYELRRFLGAGAMGAVYEALAPDGDRVAVKVLLDSGEDAGRKQLVARFKREANITSQLDSPHIVPALDAGIDSALGLLFMVMPLLVGLDLKQLLKRTGPLHPAVAVRIVRQACSALEVAHRAGVVHRDIKPANIFLDHDPKGAITVRLLDFGLAKWRHQDTAVTATGDVMGTPLFIAPEQLKSAKTVDNRSDIYSLGATLYNLLCGLPPYAEERTLTAVLMAVLSRAPSPVQAKAPWVHPVLAAIVHGSMLRDKEERCPSAGELAAALLPFNWETDELSANILQPLTPEHLEHRAEPAQLPASWRQVPRFERPSSLTFMISESEDDPLIGGSIADRYRVLRSLGKGGMGTVYEALAADGDRIALKVMNTEAAGKGNAVRRFVREARATMTIKSPHVVRVHEIDTDPRLQLPFIAMEILRGADLATLIKLHGALPPEVTARLFVQACRGLGAAHAAGLVHRDIKPANLFMHQQPSGEGVLKICDFGIVKRVQGAEADSVVLTQTTGVVGSPAYMSPEQAKSSRNVDLRTDVWSLGVSLFQTLSGVHPWAGCSTIGEVIIAICTEPIPNLQDRAPWVPAELCAIVRRAMTRDPDGRFQSMADFAQALTPFTEGRLEILQEDLNAVSRLVRSEAKLLEPSVSTDAVTVKRNDASPAITASTEQLSNASTGVMAQSLAQAPRRSRRGSLIAIGAVAVVGAITGAFFLLREPVATEQSAMGAAPSATSGAAIGEHQVAVAISPAGAAVTVDGNPRRLDADGRLQLTGKPGQSFIVVVKHEGQKLQREVFITAAGKASLERLELTAATAAPSATQAPTARSAAKAPATAAAPPRGFTPKPTSTQTQTGPPRVVW